MIKRFTILFSAAVLCLSAAVSCTNPDAIKPTKNVIVMITDGTSTSALACSRWYKLYMGGEDKLAIDEVLCGMVRSHMSDAPISGSAAAMSAYMTGVLQQSPNISVYPFAHPGADIKPVDTTRTLQPAMTVMEAAKYEQGKSTGVVVTVEYAHATPAATSSHSYSRNDYQSIGSQMASFRHDVVFSGGNQYITDSMKEIFEENGTTLLQDDIEGFRAYESEGPVWALFNKTSMKYNIDRDPAKEPSLAEMTDKAIKLLSRNKKGFFLMVEGSQVDYAGHANDAVGLMTELIAFDDAVKVALDFAKKDGNTTVVILPDHGNCGISLAKPGYKGYSERGVNDAYAGVDKIKASISGISAQLKVAPVAEIRNVFFENTGIELTDAEEAAIKAHLTHSVTDYMQIAGSLNAEVTGIVNSRLNFAYLNTGHTSEDVFLCIYNPNDQRLEGIHSNVELAGYLCAVAGLKKTLQQDSDELFVKADEVFAGLEMAVETDGVEPVLVVKNGGKELRAVANRAYVTVDGEKVDLPMETIYMKKNKTFYVPTCLKDLI